MALSSNKDPLSPWTQVAAQAVTSIWPPAVAHSLGMKMASACSTGHGPACGPWRQEGSGFTMTSGDSDQYGSWWQHGLGTSVWPVVTQATANNTPWLLWDHGWTWTPPWPQVAAQVMQIKMLHPSTPYNPGPGWLTQLLALPLSICPRISERIFFSLMC